MNKQFTTTDLALAAFLSIKGFEIITIKNGSNRKSFIFDNPPELKELIENFNFGKKDIPEVMVDARELLGVYRNLKVKLHNIN